MPTLFTKVVKVEVERYLDGTSYMVRAVWSNVDRPVTTGIAVPKSYLVRVTKAMLDGEFYGPGTISTDVNGKTYAAHGIKVLGRHLDRDLKAIGY